MIWVYQLVGDVIWVILCLIIWFNYCKGQRRADRSVAKEAFTGDLRPTTLCGCIDMRCWNIAEVLLCPLCLFSENVEKSLPPRNRCGMFGQIVCQFMSIVLFPFGWWYCVSQHIGLRQQYGKLPPGAKSTETGCCTHFLICLKAIICYGCSSMQIAEFTDLYHETFGKAPEEETTLLDGKVLGRARGRLQVRDSLGRV